MSAGTLSSCTATTNGCYATTDSQGIATAVFTVTTQPGDNFRIAASTDQNYLNGVAVDGTGLRDAFNNSLPTSRAWVTPLLTVWRKVHIEVDSMTTAGNNHVNGYTRSKKTIGSTAEWVTVSATLEEGRFQNGRMKLGNSSLEVVDNTTNAVLVKSNSGNVTIGINFIFSLFDDDDFNDNDGALKDGDEGENITFRGNTMFSETFSVLQPSTNIPQNPYAAAYVEPDYAWAEGQSGMNDTDCPFRPEIDVTPNMFPVERPIVNENRDSASMERDDFWIGYILIGYQAGNLFGTGVDGDPFGTGSVVGGVAPTPTDSSVELIDQVTGAIDVPAGGIGAIVYIETMRDFDSTILGLPSPPPGVIPDLRIRTVPHEVGHQFGLRGDNSGFGLMSVNESLELVPQHINIIRWRLTSPGVPF